jgi:hypothetical protein
MSITSANAVLMMSIRNLFDTPQQIQGFAADDIFGTDPITASETMRGVDGKLSGGFVYNEINQNYSLMADSPSVDIFDQWYLAQQAQRDTYVADMTILLTSLGTKWALTNGFLKTYPPIPDAKKVLQPRRFTITWETVSPAAS